MKQATGIPNTRELDDDQIEALIRKLSAIKGSAPELLAALQDEANSRLASKGGSRTTSATSRTTGTGRDGRGPIRAVDADYNDDDYEEETESEEDDEFDEDGPCVGHGYSDEVSVISEMTTPTVVSSIHVPEEERYNEIHQGYAAASRSKKPDLLSQVNRVNAARSRQSNKPGLASAQRGNPNDIIDPMKRNKYASGLSAMAKISEGEPAAISRPQKPPPPPPAAISSGSKSRRAPQPPQRRVSNDGSKDAIKNRTGRGLKKKSSGDGSDDTPGSKSPSARNKKSPSNHKKSTSSHGSGSRGSGDSRNIGDNGKSFADDWHKSLTGGDFDANDTDDNGFPFSFGDETDNAFGASRNSGWGDRKSSSRNAFDPFGADPIASGGKTGFDSVGGSKAAQKKTSGGASKPRRPTSSPSGAPSRPKREVSPKRKTGR